MPQRTLHRYALEVLGHGRASRKATVRVADCEPGAECQADFGRMGLLPDPRAGRRRVVHALIFTAVYSRHCFVYLTFGQDLPAVIAGCEAAWAFFGGVFEVIMTEYVPRNMFRHQPGRHPAEEPERGHVALGPRPLVHPDHRADEKVPRAAEHHRERVHHIPAPGPRIGPRTEPPVIDLSLRTRLGRDQPQHPDPGPAGLLRQVRRYKPAQATLTSEL